MKQNNRLNTSLISYVRERLWVADLPQAIQGDSIGHFIESSDYDDYLRFQMYHLMVTNYIVNLVMLGKLSDATLNECLEQGSTQKGLESLAATFLLESCQSLPLSNNNDLPDLVEVIQPYYVYDKEEPQGTVFSPTAIVDDES